MIFLEILTSPCHTHVTSEGHLESAVTFKNFALMLLDSKEAVWLTLSWNCVPLILGTESFTSAKAEWMPQNDIKDDKINVTAVKIKEIVDNSGSSSS